MKRLYLDIMEKAAKAYTTEQIDKYIKEVENDGIRDHGFPRLPESAAGTPDLQRSFRRRVHKKIRITER